MTPPASSAAPEPALGASTANIGRPRGERAWLLTACLLALLLRLGTAPEVFRGDPVLRGRVTLDGTDGYYHLRRARLILADWPHVPQRDAFLGPPDGGLISWPPLFDWTLAALSKVYPAPPEEALEAVGARLPALLGIAQVLVAAALARRLAGPRAATVTAFLAAILPAVVRYTLLGALDHDPAVELLAMLVLLALAGVLPSAALSSDRWLRGVLLAAAALAALPLTWAGSEVHLALVMLALIGAAIGGGWRAAAPAAAVLAPSAALAALLVAPFAARSVWSGRDTQAFAGLSWLHVAALCALAVFGAGLAILQRKVIPARLSPMVIVAGGVAMLALAALLPSTLAPLLAGVRFVGGHDAFLAAVAESRPLLFLFGDFDPRPALVRLSALPLLVPLLLVRWRPRRDAALGFALAWAGGATALALVQSRYSHSAGLALAVLGGISWARLPSRAPRALGAAALAPCLAAFVALPGFGGLRLYGRQADLVATGMAEVTAFLAATGPPPLAWRDASAEATDAVLAPWAYGHWIHWRARRPTLSNPFGPYGQTGFADGERFWLLTDARAAADLLRRHRIRWIVAPTRPQPPWALASLAGDDPSAWQGDAAAGSSTFLRTMGARLAGARATPPFREVYRTAASRRLPDGTLQPLLRVYELARESPAPLVTAPGRAPSGP
ncbi:MAG TPA: STT3 domain-containing protein [Thermoanaerobaculia bacterium]|jgi:asparagine N-glycosylation enzyme membrane subunit Stt3|nr:STT3 domain-containing protein [Thermoanaerobaculia bacterium]